MDIEKTVEIKTEVLSGNEALAVMRASLRREFTEVEGREPTEEELRATICMHALSTHGIEKKTGEPVIVFDSDTINAFVGVFSALLTGLPPEGIVDFYTKVQARLPEEAAKQRGAPRPSQDVNDHDLLKF